MSTFESEQWWVVALGRTLVWARLRGRRSGSAEVFDSDGSHLSYDSEDSARAALMDSDFVSFDGLDDEDAERLGIDLEDTEPPQAEDDDELRRFMVQPRAGAD